MLMEWFLSPLKKKWNLKKVWNSFNVSIVFFLNQIYYFYYSLYIILFIFFYLFVLKQCYTKFTYFKHHITIFNFSLLSHHKLYNIIFFSFTRCLIFSITIEHIVEKWSDSYKYLNVKVSKKLIGEQYFRKK